MPTQTACRLADLLAALVQRGTGEFGDRRRKPLGLAKILRDEPAARLHELRQIDQDA